jgi:hypothetical protein
MKTRGGTSRRERMSEVESSTKTVPTHPETLREEYPWIRSIETLPTSPHPEDYRVTTNLGVVEMNQHIHTLVNHGYEVQRIASNEPKGQRLYCTVH